MRARWEDGRWDLGLTHANRDKAWSLLLEEYKEVNADWRLRDKYVQDKILQSAFLFTLLGALLAAAASAFSQAELADKLYRVFPVGFFFFGVLFLFALVILISLAKDTYYRDGSERMSRLLLRALQTELDCDFVSVFYKEAEDPKDPHPVPERSGPFTRKIKAPCDGRGKLGMPHCLEQFLSRRGTFRWITAFYTLVTFLCLAASITCLICWAVGVGKPPASAPSTGTTSVSNPAGFSTDAEPSGYRAGALDRILWPAGTSS